MHCPGHQKWEKPITLGNTKEDQEVRKAALNKTETLVLEQQQPDHQPEEPPLSEPEFVAQVHISFHRYFFRMGGSLSYPT